MAGYARVWIGVFIDENLLIPSEQSEAVRIIDNPFGLGWQEIFKGAPAATNAPNAPCIRSWRRSI